ncbi:uncharacterized protein [Haliotis cracherodii]|uniref:uncharacterized protein isoform X2 n=1 Tax=Haliotis cracherodii TaxID=6455 RepID=UPI0039E96C2D
MDRKYVIAIAVCVTVVVVIIAIVVVVVALLIRRRRRVVRRRQPQPRPQSSVSVEDTLQVRKDDLELKGIQGEKDKAMCPPTAPAGGVAPPRLDPI